jgi:conjugal transfer pilus assembly protein TraV
MSRWIAIALVVITAGCAQGRSEYGCPGLPDGVVCRDTRATYAATNSADRITADQPPEAGAGVAADPARATGSVSPAQAAAGVIAVPAGDFSQGAPIIPIRTPAVVMRVWIAPWQDDAGDLMMPGYVMTEIEPRRWQIGHDATVMPSSDYYLQPVPSKDPGPAPGVAQPAGPSPAPAAAVPPVAAAPAAHTAPPGSPPQAATGTVGRGRVSVTVAPGSAP